MGTNSAFISSWVSGITPARQIFALAVGSARKALSARTRWTEALVQVLHSSQAMTRGMMSNGIVVSAPSTAP